MQESTSLLLPSLIRHISLGRLPLKAETPIRAFIAVEVERPEIIERLAEVQREIQSSEADLKPVEKENLHITMRFLGDISQSMAERVVNGLMQIKFEAFPASLQGVGVFPKMTSPRVIWAGLKKGRENLINIHQQLEEVLIQLGFRSEHESYTPHITLFRVRSARRKDSLVEALMKHQEAEFGEFEIRAIQLKRSTLTPRGPIYATLGETRR